MATMVWALGILAAVGYGTEDGISAESSIARSSAEVNRQVDGLAMPVEDGLNVFSP